MWCLVHESVYDWLDGVVVCVCLCVFCIHVVCVSVMCVCDVYVCGVGAYTVCVCDGCLYVWRLFVVMCVCVVDVFGLCL